MSDTAIATAEDLFRADELREILEATDANVDATEIEISRFAIVQPQSKEVTGEVAGYKPGQIIDNKTRAILSTTDLAPWLVGKIEESQIPKVSYIEICPIFKLPSEYIKWLSKQEQKELGKMWEFKELDFQLEHVRKGLWPPKGTFQEKGKKPPVTENINILCFPFINSSFNPTPTVASFSRTSFRTGRKFVSELQKHKAEHRPYWGYTYYLFTTKQQTDEYTWYEFNVARGRNLVEIPDARQINAMCIESAKALADQRPSNAHGKSMGRMMQEIMINSAVLDFDNDNSGGDSQHSDADEDGFDDAADSFERPEAAEAATKTENTTPF